MANAKEQVKAKSTSNEASKNSSNSLSDNTTNTISSENASMLQRAVANPRSAAPETILQLQRMYGNRAVSSIIQRSLQSPTIHVCNAGCNHKGSIQRAVVQRHAGHSHNEEENGIQRRFDDHVCTVGCQHGTTATKEQARPNTFANPGIQRSFAGKGVIQRHSSFEHKMLGDVDPRDLMILAGASNLDKNDETTGIKFEDDDGSQKYKLVTGKGTDKMRAINKADILHVLDQEIRRAEYFKSSSFGLKKKGVSRGTRKEYEDILKSLDTTSKEKESQLSENDNNNNISVQEDKEWQVRLVELPSNKKDDEGNEYEPLLVTYGEMNTLADIYGSPKELLESDPVNRYQIIQGLRNQSLVKFLELKQKVTGDKKMKPQQIYYKDAIGSTGVASGVTKGLGSGVQGELALMGIPGYGGGKKKEEGKEENEYTAGLARNACHFAPESWFNWRDYHVKARNLAQDAHRLRTGQQKDPVAADKAENDALIQNGFGDHFLQDSYAAGHLINKTQIMLWFVKWLDEHPFKSDRTAAKEWQKVQSIAYNQKGLGIAEDDIGGLDDDRYDLNKLDQHQAKDPQAVENMEGTWRDRFDALGLKVPQSLSDPNSPVFNFMLDWQQYAVDNNDQTMSASTAVKKGLASDKGLATSFLQQLQKDDVARVDESWYQSSTKRFNLDIQKASKIGFILKKEYVPKDKGKFEIEVSAIRGQLGESQTQLASFKKKGRNVYQNQTKRTVYDDYHKFLNNSLLQLSTNMLHNEFCSKGLVVETGTGEKLGRIYGDDAMLGKDSAIGVKYSAQTAQYSRQSIFDLLEGKQPEKTVDEIALRFPDKALVEGKGFVRLDKWHEELKNLCDTKIFEETKSSAKDSLFAFKATALTDKISKDQHGDGSAF